MKMNKKLLIPLFATVVGLSVVGGISGAVAWYQFNTRVNASFVGTSVADSGVLQIAGEDGVYGRHVYETNSQNGNKLTPVTFGYSSADRSAELPNEAYCHPEAGIKNTTEWTLARKNYEYIQFKTYLKAQKASGEISAANPVNVYLSEMFLDVQQPEAPASAVDTEIARALRVHLAVKNGNSVKNFLISREGKNVDLHGYLDLDGNGFDDRQHDYAWSSNNTNALIDYGSQYTQASWAITTSQDEAGLVAKNDTNYILAPRYNGVETDNLKKGDLIHKLADPNSNMICSFTSSDAVEITVTVWIEGWALLKNGSTKDVYTATTVADQTELSAGEFYVLDQDTYVAATEPFDENATYYTKSVQPVENAIWDATKTSDIKVNVGMQFDVGKNAFMPVNQ